jgi:hypothetical protein
MVKYRACSPPELSELFGDFGTIHETVRFWKSFEISETMLFRKYTRSFETLYLLYTTYLENASFGTFTAWFSRGNFEAEKCNSSVDVGLGALSQIDADD